MSTMALDLRAAVFSHAANISTFEIRDNHKQEFERHGIEV